MTIREKHTRTGFTAWRLSSRISDGIHMANVARRYPEARFIMGHIGGGVDWQWSVKAIADTPNVFAHIGGSIFDRPMLAGPAFQRYLNRA